jgi:hypothetical protein
MVTAASSSSTHESEYSDCSVNSDYDSDVVTTPNVPGILPYQYKPVARESIANEPHLQLGNRAGTHHVVSLTADNTINICFS